MHLLCVERKLGSVGRTTICLDALGKNVVRQHAFGMKHLQLAVALIDENHVTRRMYKEVLLIVSIGDE